MMSTPVSRRMVTKGAMWAVPAVAVAAAAPAMAASAQPVLKASNSVTWNILPDGTPSEDYLFRIYSAPQGNVQPPNTVSSCGPEVSNADSSTTVTAVSQTFWLPVDDLTFTNNTSGAQTSGWTVLSRDTSADDGSQDTEGNSLYAYTTTYTGPVSPAGDTICLGTQNFISTNSDGSAPHASYNANLRGTVNGAIQSDAGTAIDISQS